jgi:hypothetical protein
MTPREIMKLLAKAHLCFAVVGVFYLGLYMTSLWFRVEVLGQEIAFNTNTPTQMAQNIATKGKR